METCPLYWLRTRQRGESQEDDVASATPWVVWFHPSDVNKKDNEMKKLFIAVMMAAMVSTGAVAVDRKPIEQIDTNAFTSDTQVTASGAGENHIALAWWMPIEFWKSIFAKDTTTSEAAEKSVLDAMSGVSLIAVVEADVSALGAFDYYAKEEIEEGMKLSYFDSDGQKHSLSPVEKIDPDLEVVLGTLKPVLTAAMGNLGNNMHFYVLNDRAESSSRLLDPYEKGKIDIKITTRDDVPMYASIEMPINALFVPRKCPNGKDAHVSWQYCPWSGTKLEE